MRYERKSNRRKRVKAKLRLYPDPILKAICEPVGDDENVSGIIRDMMHILTNSKSAVGLAAPQAGHKKQVIIVRYGEAKYVAMINPFITTRSHDRSTAKEGCLSCPGIFKSIERHSGVWVSWRNDKGQVRDDPFNGLDARIIQHEIDHLNGKCKVGET